MFITFEGLDLSGKSTQARLLAERLAPTHTVRFIREPGGTVISERLRDILLDRQHLEMCDAAELFLFSASRAQLATEIIRPALQKGEVVICDRYYDSTTAYQGYGRGLNLDTITRINALATAATVPDLTILVDIPVEEVERRKIRNGKIADRMESSGIEFYRRVRSGYQAMAREESHRFATIDGCGSVEAVRQHVWGIVEPRLLALQRSTRKGV
jgi:dTMP kinase